MSAEWLLDGPLQMPYPRMWALVPLWLVLAGAVASLKCPDGRVCEGFSACCQEPGGDGYACCSLSQVSACFLSWCQHS